MDTTDCNELIFKEIIPTFEDKITIEDVTQNEDIYTIRVANAGYVRNIANVPDITYIVDVEGIPSFIFKLAWVEKLHKFDQLWQFVMVDSCDLDIIVRLVDSCDDGDQECPSTLWNMKYGVFGSELEIFASAFGGYCEFTFEKLNSK